MNRLTKGNRSVRFVGCNEASAVPRAAVQVDLDAVGLRWRPESRLKPRLWQLLPMRASRVRPLSQAPFCLGQTLIDPACTEHPVRTFLDQKVFHCSARRFIIVQYVPVFKAGLRLGPVGSLFAINPAGRSGHQEEQPIVWARPTSSEGLGALSTTNSRLE